MAIDGTRADAAATAATVEAAPSPVVVDRYELGPLLGSGGFGQVHVARDRLTGERVALKRIVGESPRVRREVWALRLLRLPGVVRLLDAGVDGGHAWLVTELVQGSPFPGRPGRQPWTSIAEATLQLLEVLGRVHAAGVVHRDLKPANVLVTPDGRPILLDFGLAIDASPGERLTGEGLVLGTPDYLAPEQVLGEPPTVRTDLYALGVMVYEALAGVRPFAGGDLRGMLYARLVRPPSPLREHDVDAPERVVEVVEALLARDPAQRPASAREVARRLREGGRTDVAARPWLPRLGDAGPLEALVDRGRAGAPADVVGPPGSGRTRLLRDAVDVWRAEGLEVSWLSPSARAFGSLGQLVAGLDQLWDLALEGARDWVDARLASQLAAGRVIVADGLESLDAETRDALRRVRERGAVVRAPPPDAALAPAIALEPLTAEALRPLFAGPERLFHLPQDAARVLFARTAGRPAAVVEELEAWLRAGLARRDGDLLAVDRASIDRLRGGLRLRAEGDAPVVPARTLRPDQHAALRWLALAGEHARPSLLAELQGVPLWKAEALVGELATLGLLAVTASGRVDVVAEPAGIDGADERRAAHARLAERLPRGTPARLYHVAAAGRAGEVAGEALRVAEAARRRGEVGPAMAALAEGLRWARVGPAGDDADEGGLLRAWTVLAWRDASPATLERVRFECARARHAAPEGEALARLLQAAVATLTADGATAFALAEAVPAFADGRLELVRQDVRMRAARLCPPAVDERALHEALAWAQAIEAPDVRWHATRWQAGHEYRRGRFAASAALHERAAAEADGPLDRLSALTGAASAWLEAFAPEQALALAVEAGGLAEALRHPHFEARCAWIARAAQYRLRRRPSPDLDLVEAVTRLGEAGVESLVLLTEAAIARDAGDAATTVRLARRAAELFRRRGIASAAALSRALALAAGDADRADLDDVVARIAPSAERGVGIQIAGLLAGVTGLGDALRRLDPMPLAAEVPRAAWSHRLDVMSVEEALACLGAICDRS